MHVYWNCLHLDWRPIWGINKFMLSVLHANNLAVPFTWDLRSWWWAVSCGDWSVVKKAVEAGLPAACTSWTKWKISRIWCWQVWSNVAMLYSCNLAGYERLNLGKCGCEYMRCMIYIIAYNTSSYTGTRHNLKYISAFPKGYLYSVSGCGSHGWWWFWISNRSSSGMGEMRRSS